MGWFTDWLDKDKLDRDNSEQNTPKVSAFMSNREVIDSYKSKLIECGSWESLFKCNKGEMYGVYKSTYKKERPTIFKDPFSVDSKIVDVSLAKIGFNPLNTEKEYNKMVSTIESWGFMFYSYHGKHYEKVTLNSLVGSKYQYTGYGSTFTFEDWIQGRIYEPTKERQVIAWLCSVEWSIFKSIVDACVRIKLNGNRQIICKGGEYGILLKEYFDRSWIDLGLKGTLFIQHIGSQEATSWSDVSASRVSLSVLVAEAEDMLSFASEQEIEELKNVRHYVNKAKEIIGEAK